ncbi:MAG: M91 family zinc metallopeptidase [Gammaproteobacteria bacterium]|jgi:hypothetical protein
MRLLQCFLVVFCGLSGQSGVWAGDGGDVPTHRPTIRDDARVRRNYLNTSRYLVSSHAMVLEGTPEQVMRITGWLDEIVRVPIGKETVEAILESGNELTIRHSEWALQASGRTLAPVSDKLTNGQGTDAEILFDARIPDQGSHRVFDAERNGIEFTAAQNLFHELVHARHLTNGTWRYFDSEGQAIEEENIFRQQHSDVQGPEPVSLRAAVDGQQIWWPDTVR